jgi:hypothetical protein
VSEQDDLIGDLIAEVARSHGVAISRDDPVVAVVLLNQIVLRRYLEETVAPAADAIRDATTEAVRQIEQFAEAQATWLEQVSLKDRASFLEEQKVTHAAWKTDITALIEDQNGTLRDVVLQTAARLRRPSAVGPACTALPSPPVLHPRHRAAILGFRPWRWPRRRSTPRAGCNRDNYPRNLELDVDCQPIGRRPRYSKAAAHRSGR